MKKIIFLICALNTYVLAFTSAPTPSHALDPQHSANIKRALARKTATVFEYPAFKLEPKILAQINMLMPVDTDDQLNPACVFKDKDEAIKAGWEFKKQTFNVNDIVLVGIGNGYFKGVCHSTDDTRVAVQIGMAATKDYPEKFIVITSLPEKFGKLSQADSNK